MSNRVAAALILLLSGCAAVDPYRRPGMWQPEGANAANMAAMVERPFDLLRGRKDRTARTHHARDAVERLWEERQRPLPGRGATLTGSRTGMALQTEHN
jgi:type IV pilus biogenesis protein CpaD/CtpE